MEEPRHESKTINKKTRDSINASRAAGIKQSIEKKKKRKLDKFIQ